MNKEIKLQFKSDPRLLKSIRALVRGYVRELGLDEERVQELVLAVDEACANAIRHAHHNKPEKLVSLSLDRTDAYLEIVVTDHGAPMPPEAIQASKGCAPSVDTVRPGGLGLKLMGAVFDDVCVVPVKSGGNCIRMRLRLS